jgi:hypothetical protein
MSMNFSRVVKVVAPGVCTMILVVVPVRAQMALPSADLQPRTNINPGLLYWQAFGALPRSDEASQKELDEFAEQLTKWSSGSPAAKPADLPLDARSVVLRYGRSLRLLQKARLSTTPCDWGADPADGPNMLVPDTRGLRALMKVSLLKAAVQLGSSSDDESVDTLLACLTLARQFGRDGTLVSVMLQQSAESQFVDYIGSQLGRYPISAVARLRHGLSKIPPRVTVLTGVESDSNFQRWMEDQIDRLVASNQGDSQKAYGACRRMLVDLFGGDEPRDAANLDVASGSTIDGLRRLLTGLVSFNEEARRLALAGPNTVDQAGAAFERRVEASSNPIALGVIPNIGRARKKELAHLSRWAMMEGSLAEFIDGDAALLTVRDPLSDKPFSVKSLDNGVVELRSQSNLGTELNPVLRVLRAPAMPLSAPEK